MSIFRYNLNFIKNIELRKYLKSKFDFEKWEESVAENATLAHFSDISKISYGFPIAKNQFIIMKKLFKKIASDFVLPYIIFNKKNVKNILLEKSYFFTNSIYYLRNENGKKEIYNYNINSIESAKKTIIGKLKNYDENVDFILEKLDNNLLLFNGNSFEIRTYILVVQIDKKIYTFLYPLLIAHFGIDNINMLEFMKFLDIKLKNNNNISSCNDLLDKIFNLIQKTAIGISNILKITNKIYKIENKKKYSNSKKIKMQYHLYTLDIILNQDRHPFLIDILYNQVYQASKEDTKIILEKNKIYNDIIENFIIYFAKFNTINHNNSKFIILNNITHHFDYKLLITKKVNDIFIENNYFLSNDCAKFLIKCLNDSSDDFFTNNIISISSEKKNNISAFNFEEEYIFEEKNDNFIEEKNDDFIEKKISELLNQESKEKIIGIASATIPLFLATYFAKKTYQSFSKE